MEVIALAQTGMIEAEKTYFRLEDAASVYSRLEKGEIQGRVVMPFMTGLLSPFAEKLRVPMAAAEITWRVPGWCQSTHSNHLANSIPPHLKRLATGIAPAWEFVKHFPREAASQPPGFG
jgi:hypothetical protein